jgi:hypothetical protein
MDSKRLWARNRAWALMPILVAVPLVRIRANGLGAGAVVGWIQRLGNDSGPTADKGFVGLFDA